MMFQILKRMIKAKSNTKEFFQTRINIFAKINRITEEEKEKLISLLEETYL